MQDELPLRLPTSKLPHQNNYEIFGGNGIQYYYFQLFKGNPAPFKEADIYECFKIQTSGYYFLRVFPVIYKFESDRTYVDRIDLPSAEVKIFLEPPDQ
jgi:hypothetical protein